MSELTQEGTAELVSRDQILRRDRGRKTHFPCSTDHEQDWLTYIQVDAQSAVTTRYSNQRGSKSL